MANSFGQAAARGHAKTGGGHPGHVENPHTILGNPHGK